MTIKKLLDELLEFSPELVIGDENSQVDRLADARLCCYDEAAVFVCDDLPWAMPAFRNCGTLIVTKELLSFIPPLAINVIIVPRRERAEVKMQLEVLLD